jgi:uncharacterized membrane protein YeaQ/YmgE (transglycosylase-associated protein family)
MSGDILVELSAYDTNLASLVTFRFGSVGYNDPSAPGFYEPRLVQPLTFRRDMFGANTTGGASRISYGEVRLANDDGGIDNLRNYGFAGQNVSLLIGDATGPYSGFTSLIIGRIQQVLFDLKGVTIQLRDRLLDLAVPIQANKYLGNNVLPNGLEGGADLQDRPKPLLFGVALNIQPPCVNTSRLEYQVNDGAINLVLAVYDAGAVLTAGADYVSQVDMETNAPAAGNYRTWKAGGYFRLGTTPSGAITCDVREGANAAARTAAQIAKRIVTYTGGIASGDVNASDVTALDTANSGILGIWINDEAQFGAALDAILGSVGAWYGFDRLGKFRMQRLEAPGGSPAATFRSFKLGSDAGATDFDIIDLRFNSGNDPDKGIPSWQVSLDYGKSWTLQQGDGLAGAATLDQRDFVSKAFRSAVASDSSVKTASPLAAQKKSRPSSSISRTRQPKPAGY